MKNEKSEPLVLYQYRKDFTIVLVFILVYKFIELRSFEVSEKLMDSLAILIASI